MASVASQLIEEVTALGQSDSLEDARKICAEGTYFPNNLSTFLHTSYFVTNLTHSIRFIEWTFYS